MTTTTTTTTTTTIKHCLCCLKPSSSTAKEAIFIFQLCLTSFQILQCECDVVPLFCSMKRNEDDIDCCSCCFCCFVVLCCIVFPNSKYVYAILRIKNDRNNDRCRLRSVSLNKTKERHHIHTSKSRSQLSIARR